MCHADFAGHGVGAAAHQGHIADGVVGRTEWAGGDQRGVIGQNACHGVDFGGFQRFVEGQRRQNGRQATGQHGFARARRANEDDVVPASRCQFEGAFDVLLPAHIAEIDIVLAEIGRELFAGIDLDGRDGRIARQHVDGFAQVFHAIHRKIADDGGFAGIGFGQDKTFVFFVTGQYGHGQGTFDGPQAAVQRQFAHDKKLVEALRRNDAGPRQHTDGNGEVEGGALFAQIGGREVDDGFEARQANPGVFDRRLDAG